VTTRGSSIAPPICGTLPERLGEDGTVTARGRWVAVGLIALLVPGALAACGSGSSARVKTAARRAPSTTTTTTTAPATTTSQPGVTVPNVIGLKIAAARAGLAAVGFRSVGLNAPCNKGTLASQSVASALSVAGNPPDARVGAVPLSPGTAVAPGTRIGITWSGCYGDHATVPNVIGLTFAAARHALHAAGLTWACYSVGGAAATTTSHAPVTTTTVHHVPTVLSQDPPALTVLHPGTPVSLTMHRCPQ
jgi:beta-lactam-binding protein with PASTA domain